MVAALYQTVEQIRQVNLLRTAYGTSLVKLFKTSFTPTVDTTAADLAAIEADFTGYTPVTFAAVGLAYLDPSGGISFDLANAFFQVGVVGTGNDIYGGWIETAGGVIQLAFKLQAAYPMQVQLAAMNLGFILNFFGPRGIVLTNNGVPL